MRRELNESGDADSKQESTAADSEDEQALFKPSFLPMNMDGGISAGPPTNNSQSEAKAPTVVSMENFSQKESMQVLISGDRQLSYGVKTSGMLRDLEGSKRLNLLLHWWCTRLNLFVGASRTFHGMLTIEEMPDWLDRLASGPPSSDMKSSVRSGRVIRPTESGYPRTDISGLTEPPELVDGSLSMSVYPSTTTPFQKGDRTVGMGACGAYYLANVLDFDNLVSTIDERKPVKLQEKELDTNSWMAVEKRKDRSKRGKMIAVQEVKVERLSEEATHAVWREIQCLVDVNGHPSFPSLIGTISTYSKLQWIAVGPCASREQFSEGPLTLSDQIAASPQKKLDIDTIRHLFLDLLTGLSHLAQKGWVHLNITPKTIIWNGEARRYVLSSFNSVRLCRLHENVPMPSLMDSQEVYWQAPEHLTERWCSHKSDIYALGMCGVTAAGLQPRELKSAGTSDDSKMQEMLQHCILPKNRPSAEDLLCHAFMQKAKM
ncbi:hypothetical protein DIPPA_06003 [Diplonema papillatum]|nr:hypothetical protein DIPPA_06003 [Diplonema papillatum]